MLSFATCNFTQHAHVELQVAGSRIGAVQHLSFPPKHLGDTAGVVHEVVLPTFKDAVAQAQLAAADVDVVIFSRGCNGTQTMRRTMRAKSGGEECA